MIISILTILLVIALHLFPRRIREKVIYSRMTMQTIFDLLKRGRGDPSPTVGKQCKS